MKLFTDLFSHMFFYGLIAVVCLFGLVLLLWGIGLTVLPFHWVTTRLLEARCPQCKGFFKKKLVNSKIVDEREVLRTVTRLDQGVLYSNRLFEPNQTIEVSRQEQVTFVEQTILKHWECKDPICGHKWQTEEHDDFEGSLES